MKSIEKFWNWYEKNLTTNIGFAIGLFFLQILHLIWLSLVVVSEGLFGFPLIEIGEVSELIIVLIDYTEIPAIILVSLVYINELRKRFSRKSILYLFLLNSQWLHLFWITDEFVIGSFVGGSATVLPIWLAWVAIFIDYLEVPVMFDSVKKFYKGIRKKKSS